MNDGLIHVGGRLKNCPEEYYNHYPILLPKNSVVVPMIIRNAHNAVGHSGREYTISKVRERYWIPRIRGSVRSYIRTCVICCRYRGRLAKQRMSDLPMERCTPGKAAFTYVGCDCFGPFVVKRGRTYVKRYGCIFTCFNTRAVHIEKLDSLDSSSFINGLVRFMSRRGVPEVMYSDNGSNYVGGVKELKKAMIELQKCERLQSKLLMHRISWRFNPPYASHMGGVWERMTRDVRKVLSIIIRNQSLDDEKFCTLLCEVESIINNRPLTPLSEDINDTAPLTPNHLLLLREGFDSEACKSEKHDRYGKRWKHVQLLAERFWKSWTRLYLPTLLVRSKWHEEHKNIQVGSLVLVSDLSVPRNEWPLARVTDVFRGPDDLIRTVKLRTAAKELVRPIHKLCVLEGVIVNGNTGHI